MPGTPRPGAVRTPIAIGAYDGPDVAVSESPRRANDRGAASRSPVSRCQRPVTDLSAAFIESPWACVSVRETRRALADALTNDRRPVSALSAAFSAGSAVLPLSMPFSGLSDASMSMVA